MHPDLRHDFIVHLRAWRAGLATDVDARAIMDGMLADMATTLGRTAFLRLKQGDPRPAFLELLPACASCDAVFAEAEFTDDEQFQTFDRHLRDATDAGTLTDTATPDWYHPPSTLLGGQYLYRCNTCGSIWAMLLPERAQRGSWQRIG